ncbi:YEATS domain-containing protein 2 [Podila clonocystis]|nr:YEATS domain-containing protein 2 [Podila clonocystis]
MTPSLDMSDSGSIAIDGVTPPNSTSVREDQAMNQAPSLSGTSGLMEDETTRQKVTDVINHQFDLEILLRHAEGAVIAKELAKAERMLEDLRHAILSERQGSPFGNSTASRSLVVGHTPPTNPRFGTRPPGARRTVSSYRMPDALYAVRADGQFVRDGNQDEFQKPRIKTYDEDVDLESEDGQSRANNRQSRKNSGASLPSSSNAGSESESESSDAGSGNDGPGAGKRRRSSLAPSMTRPVKGKSVDKDSDDSDDGDSAIETPQRRSAGKGPMRKYGSVSQGQYTPHPPRIPTLDTSRSTIQSRHIPSTLFSAGEAPTPGSRMSSAASSRANSPSIHPLMSEHEASEPSTPVTGIPARTLPLIPTSQPSHPPAQSTSASTPAPAQTKPTQPGHHQPTIISFGPSAIQSGMPAPLDTVGSRFYVKRRIVVGNVSKFLPMDKRDQRLKDFPYKWMIYVDGTPKPEDITAYVSKVEFHLHESYKPNHIVTVTEPPFHLSRFAWGETQIKVRLFFYDPRNKPVEVYHRLALDPTHCGRQVHGRERNVDLELDRHTLFQEVTPFKPRSKSSNNKLNGQFATILNSVVDVAMADNGEDDEQELQNTLSKPNRPGTNGQASLSSSETGTPIIDTVRAASIDEGILARQKAKETTLSYCKACGSLWRQHREGALGVAGSMSELVLLNEENGERIPNCPHHPKFYAAKDMGEEERVLLSVLVGRSKNKFALDMLKRCGIVDQNGRPLSAHDRLMFEQQREAQAAAESSAMDLDIGDSENSPVVDTIANVRTLSDAFQRLEVYKSRRSEIDWVLSVMDELKLKTLSLDNAGAHGNYSRDQRQHEIDALLSTPGLEKVPESISQRAIVGGLLVQATKAFLGRVLSKAVGVHRTETEAEKGPESIMMELDALHGSSEEAIKVSEKLLAPHHIYQALQSNPEELDFLTNQYEDMEGIGETMVGL